ncbi:hypothetical protein [Chitinivorax sp. B]|uniref:hypothetical protein n=1 Tax=Chitinivorax sp. B TaxID=2502235 RepID=UPI0010F93AAD|nr:hypothetical protein [Chitinivorax sp. B]
MQMKRNSHQKIEQRYFEQFQAHYRVPEGALEYTDKPDVIIRGDKTLGIEITNLYISPGHEPTSEQKQRIYREKTLACAQKLYLADGGKRIELSVDFEPNQPIFEKAPLARALANLAKQIENMATGRVHPELFKNIPQLRCVYYNATEYLDPTWRLVQGYDACPLSVNHIHEVVNAKSQKAKAYLPCDVYWLLLVIDFMDSAQDQELWWPVGARIGESPFERILLYKPQFAQVIDVAQ